MNGCVSVIVPAYNEEQHIRACLGALLGADFGTMEREIIVVDNGSKDRTRHIAEELGATTYTKLGGTIATVRNFGVARSKGEILAFVDADNVVDRAWMVNALACMEREHAAAVGSCYEIPPDWGWIGEILEGIQSRKSGERVRYIPSGNLIVSREAFTTVGGFDETLETNEDVDLSARMLRQGIKLVLDPAIRSIHLGTPRTAREMFRREMWHGKNALVPFITDPQKRKNGRVILFSLASFLLLAGVVVGALLRIAGYGSVLEASLAGFLACNLALVLLDRKSLRGNPLKFVVFTVIYSCARAASVLWWPASLWRLAKKQGRTPW